MSKLPEYLSVFRIAKPNAGRNGYHAQPQRQKRQSVSCVSCRARKSVISGSLFSTADSSHA